VSDVYGKGGTRCLTVHRQYGTVNPLIPIYFALALHTVQWVQGYSNNSRILSCNNELGLMAFLLILSMTSAQVYALMW